MSSHSFYVDRPQRLDSIVRWFSDVNDDDWHARWRQCRCPSQQPSRQIFKLQNSVHRFVLNDLSASQKRQTVWLITNTIFMPCHPTIQSLTTWSNSIYCLVVFSSRHTSTHWTCEWRVQGFPSRRARNRYIQWNVVDLIFEIGGDVLQVSIAIRFDTSSHMTDVKTMLFSFPPNNDPKNAPLKNRISTCPLRCDETSTACVPKGDRRLWDLWFRHRLRETWVRLLSW